MIINEASGGFFTKVLEGQKKHEEWFPWVVSAIDEILRPFESSVINRAFPCVAVQDMLSVCINSALELLFYILRAVSKISIRDLEQLQIHIDSMEKRYYSIFESHLETCKNKPVPLMVNVWRQTLDEISIRHPKTKRKRVRYKDIVECLPVGAQVLNIHTKK